MNEDKNKKKKIVECLSIPEEGIISEIIYDPIQMVTEFLVKENNSIKHYKTYKTDKFIYRPMDGRNPYLRDKTIILPSGIAEYPDHLSLFNSIKDFVKRYVSISEEYESITAHYVLLSWVYDQFDVIPYLRVMGTPASGKTRFLQTVGSLCYRSTFYGGSTSTPSLMRMTDQIRGTGMIDEANYSFSDMYSFISQLLNQGYSNGFPIIKTDSKNGIFKPTTFCVFGPKVIATRERFQDDAIESRCLTEVMSSTNKRDSVPNILPEEFYSEAKALRNRLLKFRFTFKKPPSKKIIDRDVNPRILQIYDSLLSVSPSEETIESLIKSMKKHNKELKEALRHSDEFEVFMGLLEAYKTEAEPTVAEVRIKSGLRGNNINDKLIGAILRNKLLLKTHRKSRGYIVPFLENSERINHNKNRFQITEKDTSKDNERNEDNELNN